MAKEAKEQLESWSGVPNVSLPVSNLGPDPRDVKTSKSRTNIPRHPKIFIKGQMNLVEKVADISKAEDEGEPLVPEFKPSLKADIKGPLYKPPGCEILTATGDSRTGITSTVESHPAPMVSSRASDSKFKFPDVPHQARKVKDDFYFPLDEYLKITHDLLKMWEVTVKPEQTKLSSASQVVTTSCEPAKTSENLQSIGFWESAEPCVEQGVTTTTNPSTGDEITEIPMEVDNDDDVIFVEDQPKHPILGRTKKKGKSVSSSAIPIYSAPISEASSCAIPVHTTPVTVMSSHAIPVETTLVTITSSSAIPIGGPPLSGMVPSAIPVTRATVSVVPPRPLIQTRLSYGKPVFPAPSAVASSSQTTRAIPQARPSLMVSIPYLAPTVPPTPPQDQSAQSQPPLPPFVSQVVCQVLTSMTSSCSSSEGAKKGGLQLIRCIQPRCTYASYNKGDFKIHMDKHLGIRYKCTMCAKDFGSDKARKTHFRTVHLGQARSICSFPNCNFCHNDHGVTRVHQYIEHGLGEAPKCQHPDCKDRDMFTNWRVFERHREGYHKEKDTQCPHCQKMYKGHLNLQYHLGHQHKGLPAFECDQCGNFFSSQKSLKVHQDSQH